MGVEIQHEEVRYEELGCPTCGKGTATTDFTTKLWQCEKCGMKYDKKLISVIDVVIQV